MFDLRDQRVWVAGHRGMVGSALMRRLATEPVGEILTASSKELDLRRQSDTEEWLRKHRPDVILLAAAKVGGIEANRTAQFDFLYDNLMIAANVLQGARDIGTKRALLLGSSCIYPRDAAQPMTEQALLTGPLEPTNEGYAVAKIASLKLGVMLHRQFGANVISLMPTNLYGPEDNWDLRSSHVLPALMRKIHEARQQGAATVTLWGSGSPKREFLHVDDLADACIFALKHYEEESILNVGTGTDVSIAQLAETLARVIGWEGTFEFDRSKPDGPPRKLLDVSRLAELGWSASIDLETGLRMTYQWFVDNLEHMRGMVA